MNSTVIPSKIPVTRSFPRARKKTSISEDRSNFAVVDSGLLTTKLFESKMTVVGSGTFELKNPILFSFLSTNQMFPSESEVNVWVNVLSVGILNSDIELVSGEILISLSARNCVVHMFPSLSLIIW